jgi:hypothetical protein
MQTFAIAPAEIRALWLIGILILVVLVPVAVILGTVMSGAHGRLIPSSQLMGGARRVDFSLEPDRAPVRRTMMGTGLPGYRSGWFRLRDGTRALLYLTDRSRAVLVPTTADYSVVLSPADPDAFLAALEGIRSGSR